ncbi:MAG TPA: hypothetical protein VK003_18780 [Oceanobacillus sp.]|nr:hypothetical protein [Oceanobacillus sp.]
MARKVLDGFSHDLLPLSRAGRCHRYHGNGHMPNTRAIRQTLIEPGWYRG